MTEPRTTQSKTAATQTRESRAEAPVPGSKPQSNTVPQQGERQERTPRAPHERDESADSQQTDEPSGQRMARAGKEDIERGLVDTDKGPALHEAYDKTREGTIDPDKKFSP